MDGHVLLLVLAAALLHATWNSIVKGGSNKLFESSMNALGGGLGALLILPFLPAPAPESWGLLALSCCFHLTYYICISQAYDKVDLSMGYTIMRGCAPMITALALLLLGNHISLTGWGGVLLLCLGILTLTLEHVHKGARAADILICLRTSLVIAGYTLADGYGARASGNGVSYTCWIFFLNIFPIHAYVLWRHGGTYISYLRKRAATGLFGGLCGLGSYGIALWAMTLAPIALVAALRLPHLLRRLLVDAARAQVEQLFVINASNGCTVTAFDVIGVNLQLRLGIDLRQSPQQQIVVGHLAVGFQRVLSDVNQTIEHRPAFIADDSFMQLAATAVADLMIEPGTAVADFVFHRHRQRINTQIAVFTAKARAGVMAQHRADASRPSSRSLCAKW